ncbi:MAG: hypothetical protein ACE5GO_04680 [Anaerolineales bacterium]
MLYPLHEVIGDPNLFVGRKKEFRTFNKWLDNIPRRLSKSRVILARRKSGKTAFVQRVFNQLWSANGTVIPFYLDIAESKIWYPNFAIKYYRSFASQYISFLERDEKLVGYLLTLEEIKEYGLAKANKMLVRGVDELIHDQATGNYDAMWETACHAPHRFAGVLDQRFLVILDEFQNLARYIYPDRHFQTNPIETLPGSYHALSESKTVNFEITDRTAEMSKTWAEYIELTLQRINDRHAKAMLLHLSKHADRYWSTRELKEVLHLDLSLDEIKHKLMLMVESDIIEWGPSDIQFRGLQDGTLNLILQHRFEEEIAAFAPDLKVNFQEQLAALQKDNRRLQGLLNHVMGQFAEHQLANEFRSRKRFALAAFFEGGADPAPLNMVDVRTRVLFQREDGKRPVLSEAKGMEIDVLGASADGRVVLVKVRKRKEKTGVNAHGIGMAEKIAWG